MREWILKWQKTIILVLAVVFIGSVVWWSLASYLTTGGNNTGQVQNDTTPAKTEAMAIVTKDGTDLSYDYWVMPQEVTEMVQQMTSYYNQYGMTVDELFQQPYLELNSVKSLIDDKIILYYANANSINPTEEEIKAKIDSIIDPQITQDSVKQAIEYRYGSVENYKESLKAPIAMQLKTEMVKEKVAQIGNDELKVYYSENEEDIKANGEQVKAAHILVADEDKANSILADINAGTISFADAASENSTDKSNSSLGGELGWFGRNKMDKAFEEAAFNAEIGSLVGPVKSSYGYHLIKVEDKKSISSFEDFLVSDAVEEAKTTLQKEKYDEWFKSYKEDNKFSYVLNDDVENAYQKYTDIPEGDSDRIRKVLEFKKWMDEFILVESDGKVSVDKNVDPRIISLYVSVVQEIKEDLEKENDVLDSYEKYFALVSDDLRVMSADELNKMVSQVNEKISAAQTEEEKDTLNLELSNLNNARELAKVVAQLNEMKIDAATVADKIKENDTGIDNLKELEISSLKILYDMNTSSKSVVQLLHSYLPNDPDVSLKWYQLQINDLIPYMNNENLFTQYKSMLDPQLMQIELGLISILKNDAASTEIKVSTYELLINMLESWKQYAEEIKYLKELKEFKPDYPDIDTIISQVEEQFEIYQQSLTENQSTDTTLQ